MRGASYRLSVRPPAAKIAARAERWSSSNHSPDHKIGGVGSTQRVDLVPFTKYGVALPIDLAETETQFS
jgi:hypothetical protein